MSEFLFCTIGFLIGYKFASLQVEKIVKREIERQIATATAFEHYKWIFDKK